MSNQEQQTELEYGTLEYWKNELLGLKKMYCVYLNQTGTRLLLYYVNKEGNLTKFWLSPDYDTKKWKEGKPSYWGKATKTDSYYYCFRTAVYGTSRSLEAISALFYWLGEHDMQKLPQVDHLN